MPFMTERQKLARDLSLISKILEQGSGVVAKDPTRKALYLGPILVPMYLVNQLVQ